MKFTTISIEEIPADTTMGDDAREKLAMLRGLTVGQAVKVEIITTKMRGFKASVTRLGKKHGVPVVVTSDDKYVYIRLAEQETE